MEKTIRLIRERADKFKFGSSDLNALRSRLDEPEYRKVSSPAERILHVLPLLEQANLSIVPLDDLKEHLLPAVVQATDLLQGLINHSVIPAQLISAGTGIADNLYRKAMPQIVYGNAIADTRGTEAVIAAQNNAIETDRIRKELESIRDSAKLAAGLTAVSKQAQQFTELADEYRTASLFWGAVVAVSICSGLFYGLYYLPKKIAESAELIGSANVDIPAGLWAQEIFGRALVISMLFFAVGWAARNFSASRHNVVTNKHRQAALSTFEALVNGVKDDPQARNAILVYAAQAIFSPASSGYGKGDVDAPSHPAVDLVSVVKKTTDNKLQD